MSFRQMSTERGVGGGQVLLSGSLEEEGSTSWAAILRSVLHSVCTIRSRIRRLWLNGGMAWVGVSPRMVTRQDIRVVMHIWEAFLNLNLYGIPI